MRLILGILISLAMAMVLACGFSSGSGSSVAAGIESGATGGSDSGGETVGGGGSSTGDGSGGGVIVSGAGGGSGGTTIIIEDGSGGGGSSGSEESSEESGDSGGEGGGGDESDGDASPDLSGVPAQTERLQVVNDCSYTIWLQQQNMVGVPSVVKLNSGESAQFIIPDAGMAATRLWPKKDCDADGNNCLMGQSSPPCPDGGCPPPVDSKFEATWGCVLSDHNACNPNPSAPWEKLSGDTYWNTSAVDGYTFPFTASVSDNTLPAEICSPVDCSNLTMDQCPTADNMSIGIGGAVSPAYSSVDLHLRNQSGALMGCYAPCTKMTYPTYGGYWLSNAGTEAAMYCCPTPPVSPSQCSSGPVETTQYVARVRSMCGGTVYTYAYDDGNGLRQCSGPTKVQLIIGPNCP